MSKLALFRATDLLLISIGLTIGVIAHFRVRPKPNIYFIDLIAFYIDTGKRKGKGSACANPRP